MNKELGHVSTAKPREMYEQRKGTRDGEQQDDMRTKINKSNTAYNHLLCWSLTCDWHLFVVGGGVYVYL